MSDSNFNAVSLLLHGDGPNNSTTITDSSNAGRSVAVFGNAEISTTESKFGGSSIRFDGAGDYLSVASAPALEPTTTGDFTAEAWVRLDNVSSEKIIMSTMNSAETAGFLIKQETGGPGFKVTLVSALYGSFSLTHYVGDFPNYAQANTWYHLALTLEGTTVRLFVDGILYGNDNVYGAVGTLDSGYKPSGGPLLIGRTVDVGDPKYMAGYIDDLRITSGVARYTEDFTPPPQAFEANGGGNLVDLYLPTPTLVSVNTASANADLVAPSAVITPLARANAILSMPVPLAQVTASRRSITQITLPRPLLTSFGGANAALVAPQVGLFGYGGANTELSMPAAILQATGYDSTGENAAALVLPGVSLKSYGGANARLSLLAPTLSMTGTAANLGVAELTAPSTNIAASGTTGGVGHAELTAYNQFALVGYSGAVASITLTDSFTVTASGTTGGTGNARLTCPLFELTVTGTAQNRGSADLLMPALRMGATAQAYLTIPGATLTAIGTAVVAVTYEAYSVNLMHRANPSQYDSQVDEATRYTNFPFDHVVRFKNSYFGVNKTGMYLLEGTTDDGAPIPFAVKTCMTDFGATEQKTVVSAYMGGRLGPEETVTLHVGEADSQPYSYQTPRGSVAQNYRQKFGRGNKARYYALGISGEAEFEIDSVDFEVNSMTRRI